MTDKDPKEKHEHHKGHKHEHPEPEKSQTVTEERKEDDEEIDFSKIKAWFKGKKKRKHKKEKKAVHEGNKQSEDEELNIDWKSVQTFFKKYGTLFLILIPIIITIFVRLQPMQLPVTENWAQNSVYNYYQNQIAQQVNQQYPNLPESNKNILIQNEFKKFKEQNKQMLEQQIQQTSQGFKERLMYESGEEKYVYLGDIDSYYWLRNARKVIETGTVCDEIDEENNICYKDTYTKAPLKSPTDLEDVEISPYVGAIIYTYKSIKVFNDDITVMQASFYVPMIFGILSAILAFLIGRKIAGNLAGLVTSIIISVNPIHLSRTLGSDNDPQNIFFPLLAILFFVYTFETKDMKKRIIYGLLTGLSVGIYAMAWTGWWYVFDSMVAALFIYLGFVLVRKMLADKKLSKVLKSKETKGLMADILIIVLGSAFFVTILKGFSTFTKFITQALWFTETKIAALSNLWPNVLVTVAEFNPASLNTIISQMGGRLLFFLGLMGLLFVMTSSEKITKEQKYLLGFGAIVYLFLTSKYGTQLGSITFMVLLALPVIVGLLLLLKSKDKVDVKMGILLAIWFVATTYAALKGVRFTLLMVSAFGVALGITISSIYRILSRWIAKDLKINETITKVVVAILLLLVLVAPVKAGYNAAASFIPTVNDAWYESLTKIKDNSEQTAIINSWWDFGHWFKYLADRRVTLDGSSQGGPPLHWLGKLMVTEDERHSMGILRMLDCGSNNAFNELDKYVKDTPASIKILDKIVTYDREKAEKTLERIGLKEEQVNDVLQYTHCEPPENFFITSEDMVGKAGVWGHFGSWDFSRAEMYSRAKGTTLAEGKEILMEDKYNLTEQQAEKIYFEIQSTDGNQWISPWPGYMSGVRPCQTSEEAQDILLCVQSAGGQQIGFQVNISSMDAVVANAQQELRPYSLTYPTEKGTEEKRFEGNVLDASLVLIPNGEGYSSLVAHPLLANSMFTRLFFMEGHGLEYFDKFDDRTQVTGGRIIVWKVDWEGEDRNQPYKQEERAEENTDTNDEESEKVSEVEESIEESIEDIEELDQMNEEMEEEIVEEEMLEETDSEE